MTDGVAFGLGCVNLGHPSAGGSRGGRRLVHRALDVGVRVFDTADSYGSGTSERVIGRALRHRRDQAFIATKAGYLFNERTGLERAGHRLAHPVVERARRSPNPTDRATSRSTSARRYAAQDFSPRYLRHAVEGSLRRLGTDHIDLLQLHGPPAVCGEEVLALMVDLRSEGKIRGFGVGLEDLDHALDWLATGALAGIQIPFGVLDPDAGNEVIPSARAHGVSVVVRAVFASGLLTERSRGNDALLRPEQREVRSAVRALASSAGLDVLQVAVWFVTNTPGVTTVLLGTSSTEHLEQGLRYVETKPPPDMLGLLATLVTTDLTARPRDPA